MATHKWLIAPSDNFKSQLRSLSPKDRRLVFERMEEMLCTEEPYAITGVEKLVDRRFENIRKIRQGNYRIFFYLEPGDVVSNEFTYKGKLVFTALLDRKEAYK